MPILNYTTTISSEKTVSEIQYLLSRAKASSVLLDYDDAGILCAVSFRVKFNSDYLSFMLPSNIKGVFDLLCKDRKVASRYKTHEQASRVAWRIVKSWLEAQIAFIEAGQVDVKQVFMPYLQNKKGETLYSVLEGSKFKMLQQ